MRIPAVLTEDLDFVSGAGKVTYPKGTECVQIVGCLADNGGVSEDATCVEAQIKERFKKHGEVCVAIILDGRVRNVLLAQIEHKRQSDVSATV